MAHHRADAGATRAAAAQHSYSDTDLTPRTAGRSSAAPMLPAVRHGAVGDSGATGSTERGSKCPRSPASSDGDEAPGDGDVLPPAVARTLGVVALGLTAWAAWALADPGTSRGWQVFWFSWITAASTGLGAAPWLFVSQVPARTLGMCNALAAGMMIAASLGLVVEGALEPPPLAAEREALPGWIEALEAVPAWGRAAIGVAAGFAFIVTANRWLEQYEHLKFGGLSGMDARKMLLIIGVMTVHSFTEGVAIGVSFGGPRGHSFGVFIATALAIHNVPEGLATSLVLIPRGVSITQAALWSIFTSIPQPLMAVPAYLAVQTFLPFLPIGLGFAGGAMGYVSIFELLSEAAEEIGLRKAAYITMVSAAVMGGVQVLLKD